MKLVDMLKGTLKNPLTGELYEGLISTVDTETAIRVLNNLKAVKTAWKVGTDSVNVETRIKYPNDHEYNYASGNFYDDNVSELLRTINNLGYFVFGMEYDTGEDFAYEKYSAREFKRLMKDVQPEYLVLQLAKKYDTEASDILPKTVYHVTTEKGLKSIQKIGLKPTTKSKLATHPDRVYVAVDKDSAMHFAKRIADKDTLHILTIDTTKLVKGTKFYSDPHYTDKAFYTYNNIPPEAIVNTEKI